MPCPPLLIIFAFPLMSVFLFEDIIFGPVRSRRLGLSLGINLLPPGRKVCTFDCVYCECGLTHSSGAKGGFPTSGEVIDALGNRLALMHSRAQVPDAITFAGNGEPTMHPDFPAIMDETIRLRDKWFPDARIGVLSNATFLRKKGITESLRRADITMLKLDAGTEETFRLLNRPGRERSLDGIVEDIASFQGKYIIQTMFVRGEVDGVSVDNSSDNEVIAWISRLRTLGPDYIMIYSLDRATPISGLEPVDKDRLNEIATRTSEETGFEVEVY